MILVVILKIFFGTFTVNIQLTFHVKNHDSWPSAPITRETAHAALLDPCPCARLALAFGQP
ncbi:hypothetical protein C4K39_4233 [Pseudomonas sessilinigenes]|nr:hypothetical protein C4K39_4233 [Pseudomonas sessilinigenes]